MEKSNGVQRSKNKLVIVCRGSPVGEVILGYDGGEVLGVVEDCTQMGAES